MGDTLNLMKKINKARVMLQKKKVKKSGKNDFSHYDYMQLEDFLPYINEICEEVGIYCEFSFTDELATLTIFDVDNHEFFRSWTSPVEVAALKGCSNIQNIGGTQTYCRRYLYIMAFEISIQDDIDGGNVDFNKEQLYKKIDKAAVTTIKKLIIDTDTDSNKFLNYVGVKRIEDIRNSQLPNIMKEFEKKQNDIKNNKEIEEEYQKAIENELGDVRL